MAWRRHRERVGRPRGGSVTQCSQWLPGLRAAIEAAVLNMVLGGAAAMGMRELTVTASALFPMHASLVEHIRSGVVTRIATAYLSGLVADAISSGLLAAPVVMQTHGGRARAIESGQWPLDAAFIAAPAGDDYGNLSGVQGPAACGPLGCAVADAQCAERVVDRSGNPSAIAAPP